MTHTPDIAACEPSGDADFALPPERPRVWPLFLAALGTGLAGVIIVSLGVGAVAIPAAQVVAILAQALDVDVSWAAFESRESAVLLAIRLPRVLMAAAVGATLAISGAAIQGLFRNPLADPALIGVSSGAVLAAALVFVLSGVSPWLASGLGLFFVPLAAFAGGALTTAVVLRLSTREGHTSVTTLLLAGIAINALVGAGIGLLSYVATDSQLRSLTFWTLGSLGGTTRAALAGTAPFMLVACALLPVLARSLDALLLGEAEAGHLGVAVERTKWTIVGIAALGVGAASCVTGIIGFVSLVVPHIVRLAVGPEHRYVLPGSALLGATLLVGADLIARTVVAPAELPIGIVTAAAGAPFLAWLLTRQAQLQ